MSILSGYNKYKRYIKTSDGYKLCSNWTSSNTVHFDDNKTAQTKLGAIDGISDSLTSTASNVAASANAVKTLNDKITQINSKLIENYTKSKIIDIATQVIEKNGTLLDLSALNIEINKDVQAISVSFIDQNNIGQYAWGSAIKYRDWWRCYCFSTGAAYFVVRCVCYY